MGFFTKLAKYLLVFVNFVFTILGFTLIGFGIWLIYGTEDSEIGLAHVAHNLTFLHITLMVLGSLTIIIAWLGFFGAIREKPWMLKTYGGVLFFILFIQMFSAMFIAFSSHGQSVISEQSEFRQIFTQYGLNNGDTLLVNTVQTTFKCCGYDSPETIRFENGTYPSSCCSTNGLICLETVYTEGCASKIWKVMTPILFTVSIVYYVILAIQVVCMFMSSLLSSSISKKIAGKPIYYNL